MADMLEGGAGVGATGVQAPCARSAPRADSRTDTPVLCQGGSVPYFSVIVPVYNSHDYLDECVSSVLGQTDGDLELILVDDGSADDSAQLAAAWAERDPRVRLLAHEHNRGASAARNTGLTEAQGRYLLFLDNDDWWGRPDALAELRRVAQACGEPDAICYWMGNHWPASGATELEDVAAEAEVNALQVDDALAYLIGHELWYSSACGKAMRLDLVRGIGLAFDEGLVANEDTAWSLRLLAHLRSVAWCDSTFYVYRRASSTSQSARPITERQLDDIARVVDEGLAYLAACDLSDRRLDLCLSFVAYVWVLLASYLNLPECLGWTASRREAADERSWLLAHTADPRVALVARVRRMLGPRLTGRLLGLKMWRERRAVHTR